VLSVQYKLNCYIQCRMVFMFEGSLSFIALGSLSVQFTLTTVAVYLILINFTVED
jgi:hypothetical protein